MLPQDSLEDMMKPGREAFEYWISFFPTAPLFGVKWRFDGMMPAMDQMMPSMDQMMPGMDAFTGPMNGFVTAPAKKAPVKKAAAPKPAPAKTEAPAPAPKPEPVKAEAAPVEPKPAKPAAKKAAPKVAKPAPVKAEAAPAKAAPKPAAKKAKAKDGKPAGLLAEKPAKADDLKMIKGVGPGLERELNALGVYEFSQIAGFSKADLTWIDNNLTAFKGRCFRDDWTGQAKDLMD